MTFRIESSSLKRLALDLHAAPARTRARISVVVRRTAFAVERDAKLLVPVDTGNLKNSITTNVGEFDAEIGPTANYGHYVEEGTSRMAPQPYMGPSAERNAPKFEAAMAQVAHEGVLGDS